MSEIDRLESIGHTTWPSLENEWVDGWLLRAGGGVTRRSNSASLVHCAGRLDVKDQILRCRQWFAARGLPPTFRLTELVPAAVDRHLAASGYARNDGAVIMTRPVAGLAETASHDVALDTQPSANWLDIMALEPGRGGPDADILRRMLQRIDSPSAYATVDHQGRTASIGLGVVSDDHVAIYMMQTLPEARRTGMAQAVVGALARWSETFHVTGQLFLQVHPRNAPAIALYEGLGFEPRYEYWYRELPPDTHENNSPIV